MNLERDPSSWPSASSGGTGANPLIDALTRKLADLAVDELLLLRRIHAKLDGLGPPLAGARGGPRGGALLG